MVFATLRYGIAVAQYPSVHHVLVMCRQWRRHDLVSAAQNYMKLFVAHKMMRNNTLNKVHVAATQLPLLLSQNTNMFGGATAQSRCQTLCTSEVSKKITGKLLEVQGHMPQCSIAGDASVY